MNHDVLGLKLDYASPETYLTRIFDEAAAKRPAFCCISNVHQCILVHDDKTFQDCIDRSFVNIPDSVILQKARSFLYNVEAVETMKGADMMAALCRMAEERNISIGLLGGQDQAVLMQLDHSLKQSFPNLKIGYAFSPPFRDLDDLETRNIRSAILASGVQLLFVGLGCPKQERWMAANSSFLPVVMLGVGAAFDFLSGRVRPSPPWVHRYGLEWLYRLTREPGRLWKRYITTSPRFVALILLKKWQMARAGSNPGRSMGVKARDGAS